MEATIRNRVNSHSITDHIASFALTYPGKQLFESAVYTGRAMSRFSRYFRIKIHSTAQVILRPADALQPERRIRDLYIRVPDFSDTLATGPPSSQVPKGIRPTANIKCESVSSAPREIP